MIGVVSAGDVVRAERAGRREQELRVRLRQQRADGSGLRRHCILADGGGHARRARLLVGCRRLVFQASVLCLLATAASAALCDPSGSTHAGPRRHHPYAAGLLPLPHHLVILS